MSPIKAATRHATFLVVTSDKESERKRKIKKEDSRGDWEKIGHDIIRERTISCYGVIELSFKMTESHVMCICIFVYIFKHST